MAAARRHELLAAEKRDVEGIDQDVQIVDVEFDEFGWGEAGHRRTTQQGHHSSRHQQPWSGVLASHRIPRLAQCRLDIGCDRRVAARLDDHRDVSTLPLVAKGVHPADETHAPRKTIVRAKPTV